MTDPDHGPTNDWIRRQAGRGQVTPDAAPPVDANEEPATEPEPTTASAWLRELVHQAKNRKRGA